MYLFLQAFFSLDRERALGFTEGPIPRRAIKEYADDFEFDDEQKDELFYVIREMDSAVMKLRNKKMTPSKPTGKK